MRKLALAVCGTLLLTLLTGIAHASATDRGSVVIVFKDGHHRSLALGEIVRIDLKSPAVVVYKDGRRERISEIDHIEFGSPEMATMPGRAHFFGKWEAGQGNGSNFFITLDEDGDAKKSIGAVHGTWTVVDGEARIAWDDGWHDVIRKVGTKHQKIAFAPGKSFTDTPDNVTNARNTEPPPI